MQPRALRLRLAVTVVLTGALAPATHAKGPARYPPRDASRHVRLLCFVVNANHAAVDKQKWVQEGRAVQLIGGHK